MGAVGSCELRHIAVRLDFKFLDAATCEIYKIFTEAGDEICLRYAKHKISL